MAVITPDKAVFLDKDGTLIVDVPYNVDPDRMTLAEGTRQGLAILAAAGFRLVIVSNQPGIARGYFPEAALEPVRRRIGELLAECGGTLAGFYFCPHCPQGVVPQYAVECTCCKPAPGLIAAAARDLQIDLSRSWMVGDILDDVEAGNRAGCRTVLLDNGHETEWRWSARRRPDCSVPNLDEAARTIVASADEPDITANRVFHTRFEVVR
jgi:histidinol-phosphate phosphatase family protein